MERITEVFMIAITILVIVGMHGYAATSDVHTTASNVTISNYVAVGLSTNLSNGILFGELDPNTNDSNATHNYDGVSNAATYYVAVSTDSNLNIDLCLRYDGALNNSGGVQIGDGNYTWADNGTANSSLMIPGGSRIINTIYQKANVTGIAPGSNNYYRFWLDVPIAQSPGIYNNTVYFKGIVTTGSC